jgi:hypothetical protein
MRFGPLLCALMVLLVAGGCLPPGDLYDEPDVIECDARDDCTEGEVCIARTCIIGACDPTQEQACDEGAAIDVQLCCADREVCSMLSLTCVPDPDAPPLFCEPEDVTCVQCAAQEECSAGQFCSSGLCLDAAGRESCSSSFQCPDGEHCDRDAFLCVPLRPCSLCSETSSHLCCFDGEECDEDEIGGVCIQKTFEIECDEDSDCGPSLLCNEAEGECFSNGNCSSDAQCVPGERCTTTFVCTVPECETASDCGDDPRLLCDGEFRCVLGPPVCDADADEENDEPANATALVLGDPFAALLCRDDMDVFSFPVAPSSRYVATIELAGGAGLIASMLNGELMLESTRIFAAVDSEVSISGVTGEDESGSMFIEIFGSSSAADQWNYVVTVDVLP